MNENPLATKQREKSGSSTFSKYEYQYHWALYRVIDEQKINSEYAIFIELHEDVVISDSLDVNHARFEFNQVKNISKPKYNPKNLTKIKNGKNSVLGNLILSANNKAFSDKISSVNLVASCGFSLELKSKGLDLDVIRVGDLSKQSISELEDALLTETGNSSLPANLKFIVPKLKIEGQQDLVIAKIAELVEHLFPGSHCNSINIYRSLIDELHRKGGVSYDYTKWNELLKNKALTSNKIKKAIETHTSLHNNEKIMRDFELIASELELKYFEKKILRNRIERLYLEKIGFPSAWSMSIKKEMESALKKAKINVDSDIGSLISSVNSFLSDSVKKKIGSKEDIKATIIFEIIVSEI